MTVSISQRSYKKIILAIQAFIAAWAGTGVFVVLFQCGVPSPWHYIGRKCIQHVRHTLLENTAHGQTLISRQVSFWSYFSAVNILTDLILIGIMVENVRRIQTAWSKKFLVISVFGCRILYVPTVSRLFGQVQANHIDQCYAGHYCADCLYQDRLCDGRPDLRHVAIDRHHGRHQLRQHSRDLHTKPQAVPRQPRIRPDPHR